jgi:spore maturation protein CgeB
MNILYYDWDSSSNNDLLESFTNLGIDCTSISHVLHDYEKDDEFYTYVLKILEQNVYDCIFSFDYIPILSLIAEEKSIPYISWIYDCPHDTLYSDTIKNDSSYIFAFDREQVKRLSDRGAKHVFHMPLAVNMMRLDRKLGALPDSVDYKHDISFVGTLYNNNLYSQINYLPDYVWGYIDAVIAAQSKIYGYNFVEEMLTNNIESQLRQYISVDDSSSIEIPFKSFMADIINTRITELDRTGLLDMLGEYFKVDLYTNSASTHLKNVNVLGTVGYEKEMPNVFRNSKINLNMSLRSITSGIPLRVLDICGCGGFCISNYQPEIAEFFELDREIVVYDSAEDLLAKADYYLKHDDERNAIARRGYEKVRNEFTYEKQLKKIFDLAGLKI